MTTAALSLPLWDILDDCIVTTTGALYRVVELRGLDPDCTTDATWLSAYDGLREGFQGLPVDALLQFVVDHGPAELRECVEDESETGELSEVLRYQRRQRQRFLAGRNLRQQRTYLAYGYRWGLSTEEFQRFSEAAYERQLEKLDELGERLTSVLLRGRMSARRLDGDELLQLLARQVRPDRTKPVVLDPGTSYPPLSPRELLIDSDVTWTGDHVRVGDLYCKVLTLKRLPNETDPGIWLDYINRLADLPEEQQLDFDHRISLTMAFPSRRFVYWLYEIGVRLAHSISFKQVEQAKDPKAEANNEDMQSLGDDLHRGERLVHVGLQIAVWAPTLVELKRRSRRVQSAFDNIQCSLFEEAMLHQDELHKTVVGMSARLDRWRLVTSKVAADLVPNHSYSLGDPNPTLIFERPATRAPFGVGVRDVRSASGIKARPNDNFLIFGQSGSGKSVTVNMLLGYGVLSGPTRGRIVAVDYAGPAKSSLLVATQIFGGRYVAVSGSGEKINPLPSPTATPIDGARISHEDYGKLVEITNILLLNTEATKDNALYTGVIQASIRRLYERWTADEAPIYSDLYEAMQDCECRDDEVDRKNTLLGVMGAFLSSSTGKILNHRSTLSAEGDFVVYDLFGLQSGFATHHRQAVALAVTQHVRSVAFDNRPDRQKYVLFDEAAQLFDVGLQPIILEMLRTARAHGCAVGMINQAYGELCGSPSASVMRTNSAREFFHSQGDDEAACKAIAEDFGFNAREKEVLEKEVRTKAGEYADILCRTTVQGADGEPERIGARARLYLSSLDEQVVSTTAEDRALQQTLRRAYPEAPRFEILAFLANEKRKRLAKQKRRAA